MRFCDSAFILNCRAFIRWLRMNIRRTILGYNTIQACPNGIFDACSTRPPGLLALIRSKNLSWCISINITIPWHILLMVSHLHLWGLSIICCDRGSSIWFFNLTKQIARTHFGANCSMRFYQQFSSWLIVAKSIQGELRGKLSLNLTIAFAEFEKQSNYQWYR